MIAGDRCVSKCRVRTAHAALPSLAKAALTSRHCFNSAASWQRTNRVRSAHPTTVHTSRCSPKATRSFPRRRESIWRWQESVPRNSNVPLEGTCAMDSRFRGNDILMCELS